MVIADAVKLTTPFSRVGSPQVVKVNQLSSKKIQILQGQYIWRHLSFSYFDFENLLNSSTVVRQQKMKYEKDFCKV